MGEKKVPYHPTTTINNKSFLNHYCLVFFLEFKNIILNSNFELKKKEQTIDSLLLQVTYSSSPTNPPTHPVMHSFIIL
jgi:hypothetical protein